MVATILDQHGKPFWKDAFQDGYPGNPKEALRRARYEAAMYKRQLARAKFDAAQSHLGNEHHWANADNYDPHTTASPKVRRDLRSRSRYEVIENNPFLKGTVLTIANDFVGSGPKLDITDKRIPKEMKKEIETRWVEWSKKIQLRRKLWRAKIAKIVDGETVMRFFTNRLKGRTQPYPLLIDVQVLECDRLTTEGIPGAFQSLMTLGKATNNEIDGLRFDQYDQVTNYHLLRVHPGAFSAVQPYFFNKGDWYPAHQVIHWFRQDRGWLRGIPELTPSLPLCAILRRYTLATLRHAETAADFAAVLETDGPPSGQQWADTEDDPFQVFHLDYGAAVNLPWGYKLKQLSATPDGVAYDEFVGAILREITRPLLVPFNMTVGTSKDSNMASSVVDVHMYREGQNFERMDCEDMVLDHILVEWWLEAIRTKGYISRGDLRLRQQLIMHPPEHRWRWDSVGVDHTDPQKVASALETLRKNRFITDRDIQERYFDRSREDWQNEIKEDEEFRQTLPKEEEGGMDGKPKTSANQNPSSNGKSSNGKPSSNGNGKVSRT